MAYLDEYEKITIDKFRGLYLRGLSDECPQDHSSVAKNLKFTKRGEVSTRDGVSASLSTGHAVVRLFLATFSTGSFLLTCDGAGHIYQGAGTLLLTVTNMVDFVALNVFNKCLIVPILSAFSNNNPVYIWDGSNPPRAAAGAPPSTPSTFAAATGGAGNVDIGTHKFAVSFITSTGFTTPPGPAGTMLVGFNNAGPAKAEDPSTFAPVSYVAPGGASVNLTNIPTGPAGTVSRQIFVTQADQEEFFYCPGGFINDNATTSLTVNFYDTDLAISADPLFDLLTTLPGATTFAGIQKYHGRTFLVSEGDLVRASNAGDCESYDNVAGFIQMPSENDGNDTRAACVLNDVLYFTKAVGILAVTDNGGVPSSWGIVQVDGGCGSFYYGIETITASQSALSANQIILLSDFGGLYAFSGVVQRPALTWKVEDFWIAHAGILNTSKVTVAVNPFTEQIYILFGDGSLLVGDYSEGLDSENIKWSTYSFAFTPTAIGMANFNDGSDFSYYLRLGAGTGLNKLVPGATNDLGSAIDSVLQTAYLTFMPGARNIFRHIRSRAVGVGNVTITLISQDGSVSSVLSNQWALSAAPGKDFDRQINFVNEKMSTSFEVNAVDKKFTIQRIDVYGKKFELMRPQ